MKISVNLHPGRELYPLNTHEQYEYQCRFPPDTTCVTYRSKKQGDEETNLTGKHERKVHRRVSQDDIQEVRNSLKPHRWSPGSGDDDRECKNIWIGTIWSVGGICDISELPWWGYV